METSLNTFLFVYWGTKKHRKQPNAQKVIQDCLWDHIVQRYNMGKSGFLFTSESGLDAIKADIPEFKGHPFMIIDITESVEDETIGFMPNLTLSTMLHLTNYYKDLSLDGILDKMSLHGKDSLTELEREFLKRYEKK